MVCTLFPKLVHSFYQKLDTYLNTLFTQSTHLKSEHYEAEIGHCSNTILKISTQTFETLSINHAKGKYFMKGRKTE